MFLPLILRSDDRTFLSFHAERRTGQICYTGIVRYNSNSTIWSKTWLIVSDASIIFLFYCSQRENFCLFFDTSIFVPSNIKISFLSTFFSILNTYGNGNGFIKILWIFPFKLMFDFSTFISINFSPCLISNLIRSLLPCFFSAQHSEWFFFLLHFLRYYLSTREGKPGQRHLYSVRLNLLNPPSISSGDIIGRFHSQRSLVNRNNVSSQAGSECLTCHLDPECQYYDVTFSPGSSYFVLECQGPGVPKIHIRSAPDNKLCKYCLSDLKVERFQIV